MSVSKLLAGTAVIAALTVSTSAQAADYETQIQQLVVSGVVESWFGYTLYGSEDNIDEDIGNHFSGGRSARLSLPLGDNFSIQMDFDNETNSDFLINGGDDDNFQYSYQWLAHLNWRDPSTGLFGVFGGLGDGTADDQSYDVHVIGGEGQLYLNDFTLYGQAGWFDSSGTTGDDDGMRDAGFGRGVVRWFLAENARLQAEVSYAAGTVDGNDDGFLVEWGGRYDTRLGVIPVLGDTNMFVGYRGGYFENEDNPESYMDHTFMVGFRASFGGDSMRDFDRVGATLDAPNFGRWVGSGNITD